MFLANFVGFNVFSFTVGHNFPYPKIYFLGVGWLWLISKNHCGGPLKSNIAIVTKFPVLQQLHLGENGFLIGFSLGMTPKFCCRVFSFLRFQVLLKKTVMTDFYQSFWQNMKRKSSDKFLVTQRHLLSKANIVTGKQIGRAHV